ncbi:type A2 lanthipeptide [Bacillus solimangrovi]|uniref:Lantibiotic n=1 Tax=Bacillus solimangrovi TaxID=1305675 RepID=A0A1E5LFE1_9BACI|nr:type A2 lanthipeptide [Bacillus solimangrovi]OEH92797.1 lantibiotic salivaricin A [Bacillus solimangrovi]
MENLKFNAVIEDVTDQELDLATGAGAKPGDGWISTITDDCPNSIIVCC